MPLVRNRDKRRQPTGSDLSELRVDQGPLRQPAVASGVVNRWLPEAVQFVMEGSS